MEASEAPQPRRAKRPRSPSYPGIGLEQAIERARMIYEREGRNLAPINAITQHWGYSAGSGSANVAVSALRKFGLLEATGSGSNRQARLTDLALRILLDTRDSSPERAAAIQTAALEPGIHADLLAMYPDGLPSDPTLIYYLTFTRHFTDGAARELVSELRGTLEFAGLSDRGDIFREQETDRQSLEEPSMPPTAAEQAPTRAPVRQPPARNVPPAISVNAPLPVNVVFASGQWATLQVSARITDADWAQLMAVVNAMKPGLIEQQSQPIASDDE